VSDSAASRFEPIQFGGFPTTTDLQYLTPKSQHGNIQHNSAIKQSALLSGTEDNNDNSRVISSYLRWLKLARYASCFPHVPSIAGKNGNYLVAPM
jgi:hypothetical protein